VIFKGIIDDIFPNPIKQSSKRSSLKSLLEDVMQSKTMSMTEEIMDRVLHLYETIMIRHGVMVVGSTMTGKTTSIQLL
jgi:dynein heavy chain, axonemal